MVRLFMNGIEFVCEYQGKPKNKSELSCALRRRLVVFVSWVLLTRLPCIAEPNDAVIVDFFSKPCLSYLALYLCIYFLRTICEMLSLIR